jgi:hypothetical protein
MIFDVIVVVLLLAILGWTWTARCLSPAHLWSTQYANL